MPLNTIQFATTFQQTLDKQVAQQAVTGWMEPNASMVHYSGGREVKIPKIVMDGLANYDRSKGYVQGSVTLEYQTREMTQDRGRKFLLDAMDVDETNFVMTASTVAGEFQRVRVIPEIDAYRISRLARIAGTGRTRAYTAAANSVLGALIDDIYTVRDKVGDGVPLVVQIAFPLLAMMSKSTEFSRQVALTDFAQGGITTRVRAIDDVPLLPCTSGLMKTAFTFKGGTEAGEEAGGFEAAAGAVDINWQVIAKSAPIAISKTDVPRVFDPMTNQSANAWQVDYRKYHDLWVLDNQMDGLFINAKTMPTYE